MEGRNRMSNTHTQREAWLNAVLRRIAPVLSHHGYPLSFNVRVTCGFPSVRSLNGQRNQRIGECWSNECSKDNHYEIMISPVLDDPMRVAGVLAHEMIHAAVGLEHGHKGPFVKLAKLIGLEGKMTATTEGEAFKQLLAPILEEIGPYPHGALNAAKRSSGPKKQGTRLVKAQCPECGYVVRTTMKWIDEAGNPHCPLHGPMELVRCRHQVPLGN
jgi:hypothetical protein